MLGVRPEFHRVHLSPIDALKQSFGYIGLTFKAITGFFDPRRFSESISQSSSVIGASYIAAEAAKSGPIDYAYIVGLLSLSLGVINIFPIPPLDGGKIVLEIFERIRGRQISRNVSIGLSVSGATLLFALVGYLMYADIVKFIVSS
jgi:regulator of sigma E protease